MDDFSGHTALVKNGGSVLEMIRKQDERFLTDVSFKATYEIKMQMAKL